MVSYHEGHPEMAGYYFEVLETIKEPEIIYEGKTGENIAVKDIEDGKYIIVIYRELDGDGFVITAFLTKRRKQFERRRRIWEQLK